MKCIESQEESLSEEVTLSARVWIEISDTTRPLGCTNVTLSARVWIEIV